MPGPTCWRRRRSWRPAWSRGASAWLTATPGTATAGRICPGPWGSVVGVVGLAGEREVRFANDANCFALSEAIDGAAAGASVVFGAILGTGVGGGIVVHGAVLNGHHGIGGEWGHTPLPWMTREEHPGPMCNCGRLGCIEQWCSGPALGREKDARGEENALAVYADRLARALSLVVNFLDPEVIVVGGGVSRESRIYASVPELLPRYVYAPFVDTRVVPARHGDASGVRGAAMLWPA
jgi:fructokinase